jgi:hypothetical protein
MLVQLSKRPEVRPASVLFELEAGTQARAEPERLRDFIEMARDLFFRGRAGGPADPRRTPAGNH